jgi:hypothetical protein
MLTLILNSIYSTDNKNNYLIFCEHITEYLRFIIYFSDLGLVKYFWNY